VETHLRRRRAQGAKLLAPYLTGGVTEDWIDHLRAYAEAGADAIEIGLPFSDPILDGPTIAQASDRALARGVTTRALLEELTGADVGVPLIAMTYYNLIVADGADVFCGALARAGLRGLIVPDVPLDEADDLCRAAATAGIDLTLLAAPVTGPQRLARIAEHSRGFVYALTRMDTTGERDRLAESAGILAGRLKQLTDRPVLLGFGISTPQQAADAAAQADGVVVGAALMRLTLDGAGPDRVGAAVAGMRAALDAIAA
jgi:tryptophan synthase alpha chain